MSYPLANDDNGVPLDVPGTATGWLVRRHGGGRGRPAAVYDAEGRPLVVPIEATAADLRAAGCAPGAYRLDAVDADRRLLNLIAYTEIGAGVEAGSPAAEVRATTPTDAFLLTVARSLEAMQRAQIERERQNAELIKHLVDTLAARGQGGIAWNDLDAYEQRKARDVEAARRNGGTTPNAASAVANEPAEADDAEDDDAMTPLAKTGLTLLANAAPMVVRAGLRKFGYSHEELEFIVGGMVAGAKTAAAAAAGATEAGAEPSTSTPAVPAPPPADEGDDGGAKLKAVLARLTPDERLQADTLLPSLPDGIADRVITYIDEHPVEQSVGAVRAYLKGGLPALITCIGRAAA